jgi:hypothetical protein
LTNFAKDIQKKIGVRQAFPAGNRLISEDIYIFLTGKENLYLSSKNHACSPF